MKNVRNSKLNSQQTQKFLNLVIVTFLIAGCGNIMNSGRPQGAPSQNLQQNVGGGTPPNTYNCPSGFNVSPVQDPLTGDGYYQVCQKVGETAQLSVWGVPDQTNTVCVYPAEQDGNGNLFLKVDLSTSTPSAVKECVTMQSFFNEVPTAPNFETSQFRLVNFTHVFVIENTDVPQFEECMGFRSRWGQGIDLGICPNPSSGTGIVSWGDLRLLNTQ